MSTISTHRTAPTAKVGFGGILRSEWIKLLSLRSTVWCYAIIVVVTIGLGMLLAFTLRSGGQLDRDSQQTLALQVTTLSVGFSQLVSSVLGALVITGEYGTGMIRSTFTAVPRRLPALIAKVLVLGVTTFVVSLVSMVITALITAPALPNAGVHPDFGDPAYLFPIVGAATYLALIGVLSLAIGAIIRNSAGGIAAALGLLLVVPTVLQILVGVTRAEWAQNVGAFLPGSAGSRMYSYATDSPAPTVASDVVLDPWQGALVLVIWVVALFVIASALLKRRDA